MREWEAERDVGAVEAAELVAGSFPELAGRSVVPLAQGWDNTVHLVDGRWAFRFPRRTISVPGAAREIALLPRLAPLLPVPVPVPVHVGAFDGADGAAWPFAGSALLPGRELAEAALPDGDRAALAADVGAALRVLHAVPVASLEGVGLPVDPNVREDAARVAARCGVRLDQLEATGAWGGGAAVRRLVADAADLPGLSDERVVCHGDLHVRHVLVGPGGRATGLLDWGDACLADPAVDLAFAFAAVVGDERRALLEAYGAGALPAERELRARVLAALMSALLALTAAALGQRLVLGEALAGLRRAIAA